MLLSDVKAYLRVDHDLDDSSIQDMLTAAEGYLRRLCQPFLDGEGDPLPLADLPADFQMAIKQLVGHWYDRRGATDFKQQHELPFCVNALIASFRG